MSLWAEGVLKSLVQLSLSVEVVGSWPGHNGVGVLVLLNVHLLKVFTGESEGEGPRFR